MPGIDVISDSTWSFRPVTRNFSVVSCMTPPWCLSVEKEVYYWSPQHEYVSCRALWTALKVRKYRIALKMIL